MRQRLGCFLGFCKVFGGFRQVFEANWRKLIEVSAISRSKPRKTSENGWFFGKMAG